MPVIGTRLVYDNGGGGGAVPVGDYFLNAEIHRVRRSFQMHNFEINILQLLCSNGCPDSCGPTNVCSWDSSGPCNTSDAIRHGKFAGSPGPASYSSTRSFNSQPTATRSCLATTPMKSSSMKLTWSIIYWVGSSVAESTGDASVGVACTRTPNLAFMPTTFDTTSSSGARMVRRP